MKWLGSKTEIDLVQNLEDKGFKPPFLPPLTLNTSNT